MKLSLRDRAQGVRLERVRSSPRYRDGAFRNTHPFPTMMPPSQALPVLGEYLLGAQRREPPAPLPHEDPRARWAKAPETGLRATWLGHSTVLLEIDGHRVLTDPVWSDRASPSRFVGPRRFQPVPVPLGALGPLDAVLLSHDHYDHLDRGSVEALARTGVPWFTALGVGARLEAYGVAPERITELDWWESAAIPDTGLRVTAAPARHFSGRSVGDRDATLWCSLVVEGPRHKVFFSGDTGLTDEYAAIAEAFAPFDLALLEVGAFHPSWGSVHLGPHNALEALRLLGAPPLLPVHWGTFNLALHAWDDPAETLFVEGARAGTTLVMPRLGAPTEPARFAGVDPWWRALAAPAGARARLG